ncbi:unnamed protein product [Chrysoparadoxa australica]
MLREAMLTAGNKQEACPSTGTAASPGDGMAQGRTHINDIDWSRLGRSGAPRAKSDRIPSASSVVNDPGSIASLSRKKTLTTAETVQLRQAMLSQPNLDLGQIALARGAAQVDVGAASQAVGDRDKENGCPETKQRQSDKETRKALSSLGSSGNVLLEKAFTDVLSRRKASAQAFGRR